MTYRTQPTADHFALAIVAACREVDEDPIAVATGQGVESQAQLYAFAAMRECFAEAPAHDVAALLGVNDPVTFVETHEAHCGPNWWSDSALNRIVEAIESSPYPTSEYGPVELHPDTPFETLSKLSSGRLEL